MPDWACHIRAHLTPLRLAPERELEIVEELSQHLEDRYSELRMAGTPELEAEELALNELPEPGLLAGRMRALRQSRVPDNVTAGAPASGLFADLWHDVRFAGRTLRRQPGFAAAVILTLALGIGANSTIFALVDATLLRPLPFPDSHRLMVLWETSPSSNRQAASPPDLVDWNARNSSFEAIGGLVPNVGGMVMANASGPSEDVPRQWVTARYFQALGATPVAGRLFIPSDDRQGTRVVVLTESYWRSRFNADPSLPGSEIRLDGDLWTVVGVAPDTCQLLSTSIWALRPIESAPAATRRFYSFLTVGRLKPGVSSQAAQSEMTSISQGLAQEFPQTNAGRGVWLEPLRDVAIGGELRRTSVLFLAVVGFVLLICCVNVANLLLARSAVRARELAIRLTLGANRARIIRQLMTESLLLAGVGGALGLAVGAAIITAAPAIIPKGVLPATVSLAVDFRIVLFCGAVTVLAGFLFGVGPAWQVAGKAPAQFLSGESRTTTGRDGRLRGLLVAGEVASAVLLLFGAGLLLRTLLAVDNVDPGYRASSILTMIVDPPDSPYPTAAARLGFYRSVAEEISGAPGVRDVAWATTLPMGRSYQGSRFIEVAGETPSPENNRPVADYQIVSPDYFTTLDLPIVAGRSFDDRDSPEGVPVCIVNEAFARRHFSGRSAIGHRVRFRATESDPNPPQIREIVGVARQVKRRPDEVDDLIQTYVPLAQDTPGDIFLLVRPVSGIAEALAPGVRAAISRVDRNQMVSVRSAVTLDDVAREATSRHRFRAVLVTAFAVLALLLAMVGVFGIISYSVQRRVREFGVRRALGATTTDVFRTVAGSVTKLLAAGLVSGLILASFLAHLMSTVLFGVQPLDPATFVAVVILIILTAMLSIAAPAWRAARIDPAVALRQE